MQKDFCAGLKNRDFVLVDQHLIEQKLYDRAENDFNVDIIIECDKVEDEYILANVNFSWDWRTGGWDITTFDVESQLNGGYNEYKPGSAEDKALEQFLTEILDY